MSLGLFATILPNVNEMTTKSTLIEIANPMQESIVLENFLAVSFSSLSLSLSIYICVCAYV